VLTKVEDSGVAVARGTPEPDDDLQAIAAVKVEGVEESEQFRVIEELREPRPSGDGTAVDGLNGDVEVGAESAPVRPLLQDADDTEGFRARR
jgi:hypothetical protein